MAKRITMSTRRRSTCRSWEKIKAVSRMRGLLRDPKSVSMTSQTAMRSRKTHSLKDRRHRDKVLDS
jgi:hypothetical protein